jgi:hypothetical protein
MGAAAIPLLIASTAVSAYSSLRQGQASAEAANFERSQYEEQRKMSQIQGLDEEADRRRRLEQVLASNRASATTMGIGTDGSRSFLSVQQNSAAEAERDIGRIRLNAASAGRRFQLASDQAGMAASNARTSGFIGAGQSLLSGAFYATQLKTK